jgi:acyl dehydratase
MAVRTIAAAQLAELIGQETGVSDWIEVSQSRIDLFADATLDHQFIHVDPARARETPFGGTIAHGFLSLSLLSRMANEGLPAIENTELSINYGMNRLRFLTPVKSGERLRGRFVLREVAQKKDHQLLLTYDATVEIEGGEKPALVAEWLVLYVLLDA